MDHDPQAQHLYEAYFVPTEAEGKGRHSVIHGAGVGYLCGLWLEGQNPFVGGQSVPIIPGWDQGDG